MASIIIEKNVQCILKLEKKMLLQSTAFTRAENGTVLSTFKSKKELAKCFTI